jgi:hypothetical protein
MGTTGSIQFYICADDHRYARVKCTSQLNLWSLDGPVVVTVRAVATKQTKNAIVDLPDQTIVVGVTTKPMFFTPEVHTSGPYNNIGPKTVPPQSGWTDRATGLVATWNGYLTNAQGEYLFIDVHAHTLFELSAVYTKGKLFTSKKVVVPHLVPDNKFAERVNLPTAADCFPADATCLLETGATVRMSDLVTGDRVMSPAGYSTIIGFSHRELHLPTTGVEILVRELTGGCQHSMRATPGHLVPVNAGTLVPAYHIRVGDTCTRRDSDGTPHTVEVFSVCETDCMGAVAPLTDSGTITVNGIDASCYTVHFHQQLADACTVVLSTMHRRLPQPCVPAAIRIASSLYRSACAY